MQFKAGQVLDEFDNGSNEWLARYILLEVCPDRSVRAICMYDKLNRDYVGETAEINMSCILRSNTFFWRSDGKRVPSRKWSEEL